MNLWTTLQNFVIGNPFAKWLLLLLGVGLVVTVFRSFFQARKIQPNGFRWRTFRNEILFGIISLAITTTLLGLVTSTLMKHGIIQFNTAPARWWVVLLEY